MSLPQVQSSNASNAVKIDQGRDMVLHSSANGHNGAANSNNPPNFGGYNQYDGASGPPNTQVKHEMKIDNNETRNNAYQHNIVAVDQYQQSTKTGITGNKSDIKSNQNNLVTDSQTVLESYRIARSKQ